MPSTVSVRVLKATQSKQNGNRSHSLRLGKVPSYVDVSRSVYNTTVIEPPTARTMMSICLARRQARYERGEMKRTPRGIRRDGVIALEGLITFSTEGQRIIEGLTHVEQARRYETATRAVAELIDTDIAGLVIHRDESAPHAHFTLFGYTPDGSPVSGRIKKQLLSQAQDTAANAYCDLGIKRGKNLGDRLADGDDASQTINRSVRQLHNDLPAELAQAQAKVDAVRAEADEAMGRLEEIESRITSATAMRKELAGEIEVYRRRLNSSQQKAEAAEEEARRFAALDMDAPSVKTRRIPVEQQRGIGPWARNVTTYSEPISYIDPSDATLWRGSLLRRTQNAVDAAERRARQAEEKRQQAEEARVEEKGARLRLQRRLMRALILTGTHEPADAQVAVWACEAEIIECYELQMQMAADIARVPRQAHATNRQIAAALYDAGLDQGWEQQWFQVPLGVAREIIDLARRDGRLDRITFQPDGDGAAADLLEAALKEYEQTFEDPLDEGDAPPRPDLGL